MLICVRSNFSEASAASIFWRWDIHRTKFSHPDDESKTFLRNVYKLNILHGLRAREVIILISLFCIYLLTIELTKRGPRKYVCVHLVFYNFIVT